MVSDLRRDELPPSALDLRLRLSGSSEHAAQDVDAVGGAVTGEAGDRWLQPLAVLRCRPTWLIIRSVLRAMSESAISTRLLWLAMVGRPKPRRRSIRFGTTIQRASGDLSMVSQSGAPGVFLTLDVIRHPVSRAPRRTAPGSAGNRGRDEPPESTPVPATNGPGQPPNGWAPQPPQQVQQFMESPAGKFLKSIRWSLVARIVGVMVLALGIMLATTFEYETTYYLNGGSSTEYPVRADRGGRRHRNHRTDFGAGPVLTSGNRTRSRALGDGPTGPGTPGQFPTGPRFPGAQQPPQQPGWPGVRRTSRASRASGPAAGEQRHSSESLPAQRRRQSRQRRLSDSSQRWKAY